ncbi:molybdopterin-guanine dinucleotide biosynthesis protein MobB [Tistrella bauzanensis]|uniref:Molybdopterin-guanine dinucleotide biosynthesis protein MobB n=1 Tax=Tistrella bauzanensis TaxID=657419 RepID=A0ABQ1I7N9_9PROT|nr:molybdopterin-guanine dinucleotide biosynthesis protein B [Tistrella bauzanensis]GGB25118.1 molybdopterin-guanine dinucleotide biosynthesis protein MobB [Tistrella bauzanensis]
MTRIIGLVGPSGSGKTTLIERLIPALAMRGLKVVTVKRSHHRPDLDRPGKDSDRHRMAGAAAVVVGGGGLVGVLREEPAHGSDGVAEPDAAGQLRRWLGYAGAADVAIVEGFAGAGHPRLELLMPARPGRPDARWPLFPRDDAVRAVVVPDPSRLSCGAVDRDLLGDRPILGRNDIAAISALVLSTDWPAWC